MFHIQKWNTMYFFLADLKLINSKKQKNNRLERDPSFQKLPAHTRLVLQKLLTLVRSNTLERVHGGPSTGLYFQDCNV